MANQIPRYRPSGYFRITTIPYVLGVAVAAALVAWLYQMLLRWIPFIYINLVIAALFAGLVGFAGAVAMRAGHCRNRLLAYTIALPLAAAPVAASHYWSYRADLGKVLEETTPGMTMAEATSQIPISDWLAIRKAAGWRVKSSTVNGNAVLFVWGVEALLFLGLGLYLTGKAAGEAYCERCNRWCVDRAILVAGLDRAAVDPLVAAADLDGILALAPPPDPPADQSLKLTLAACPACRDTGFLSVDEQRVVQRKNKQETKEKTLVSLAVLSPAQRARLGARTGEAAPPVASAAG